MSALDALNNEYHDGIPVPPTDDDAPNYARGLKALARYIDEELDTETDHAALSGLIGRHEEKTQEKIDELKSDLKDVWGQLEKHLRIIQRLDKARGLEEVRQDIEDLYDQLYACVQGLTEHEDEIGEREREINGLDTRLTRTQDRVSGLEEAVYGDERTTAPEALRRAKRAEQKADDTDQVLGQILEQVGLKEHPDAPEEPRDTGSAPTGAGDVTLTHMEVSSLVQDVYPDASIIGFTEAGAPDAFPGTIIKLRGTTYRVAPDLRVAEETGHGPRQNFKAAQVQPPLVEEGHARQAEDESIDSPGKQTVDRLKRAVEEAFDGADLEDCVATPELKAVRFTLRGHRYRATWLDTAGVFVEEVDQGVLKHTERASLVEDALAAALS